MQLYGPTHIQRRLMDYIEFLILFDNNHGILVYHLLGLLLALHDLLSS